MIKSEPNMKGKKSRFRFSIRTLIVCVTMVAATLGGWITFANFRIQKLAEMRQLGAIVVFRDGTPQALQSFGIKRLSPFFEVPTVELYITPMGSDALVGNSEALVSSTIAQVAIREQAATARKYGANDVQLVLLDSFAPEWFAFAQENSLTSIGDSKQRYLQRLKANQESGANINP